MKKKLPEAFLFMGGEHKKMKMKNENVVLSVVLTSNALS